MKNDKIIRESELILNPDGSVYHLKIKPSNLARHVILVGDPGRVSMVSDLFETIDFKGHNREFIIHTGSFMDKKITVMSTGMGTDNIDIVLNELDALVNIDLENRKLKSTHSSLNLYRVGTSGSLQPDLPLNSVVLSEYGLGFDGMLYYYDFQESEEARELREAFLHHTRWETQFPRPYLFKASATLRQLFDGEPFFRGITVTAPGFYGPQGRKLRLPLADPDLNEKLRSFGYKSSRILNYEMETSALYGLSKLLGHQAITLCLAIANRNAGAIHQDHHRAMKNLIKTLLDKIAGLKD